MLSVLGPAQRIEPADLVQRGKLLFDRIRNSVLRQQFADRAVLAFGAGAVVAENVDHDGVVANAETIQFVHHPAGLHVDMLDEAGEDFHQPPLERALRLGNAVPAGIDAARGVSLVSAGIQPSCFWRANTRSR